MCYVGKGPQFICSHLPAPKNQRVETTALKQILKT